MTAHDHSATHHPDGGQHVHPHSHDDDAHAHGGALEHSHRLVEPILLHDKEMHMSFVTSVHQLVRSL